MAGALLSGPGLSPRVRGNLGQLRSGQARGGSIPACAGEPHRAVFLLFVPGVYPRVCGGTWSSSSDKARVQGLSPRVRGNPADCSAVSGSSGSIPACAGEPEAARMSAINVMVYPRVCGGTSGSGSPAAFMAGLSPRVRGNLVGFVRRRPFIRSIPACAGEPAMRASRSTVMVVYPRVCGGTGADRMSHQSACGLSPRVRGNQNAGRGSYATPGSIPACAGEPSHSLFHGGGGQVYPRVCGGTLVSIIASAAVPGLSPRVRGNRHRRVRRGGGVGSIPACAGEPPCGAGRRPCGGVYPRVCGGTIL